MSFQVQGAQAVHVPMPQAQYPGSQQQQQTSQRPSQRRPRPEKCPSCDKSLADPTTFRCRKFNFRRGVCGACARKDQRQARRVAATNFAAASAKQPLSPTQPPSPTGSSDSGIGADLVLPWTSQRDPAEQLREAGLLNIEVFHAFCDRNFIMEIPAFLERLAQVVQDEVDAAEAAVTDMLRIDDSPLNEFRGSELHATGKRCTRGGVFRGEQAASKRGTAGNKRDSAISVTSDSVDDDDEEEENNEPHCEGVICQAASKKLAALCAMSQSDQKKNAQCLLAPGVDLDQALKPLPENATLKVDKVQLVPVQHCQCAKHAKHAMCVNLTGFVTKKGHESDPFCALMCIAFLGKKATYRATCLQFQRSKLGMVFLDDVTIPDNTKVKHGKTVCKKWKVLNIGHEAFGVGTSNVVGMLQEWDRKKSQESRAVPATEPGEVAELAIIDHKIPRNNRGQYLKNWILHKDGIPFGDPFWMVVRVV